MKKQRNTTLSGPVLAVVTLSLTLIIFFAVYTVSPLFINRGEEFSPVTSATATPLPTPAPSPTPSPTADISPRLVDISTKDATHLKAIYYPPPNNSAPGAALLLLHMAYSNKDSWQTFAKAAQETGYAVLAVDLRGHGESGGTQQFDTIMDSDIDAVLAWLMTRQEVDKSQIGIVGASVGANLALRAGARHPTIKSVALLSPGLNYWKLTTDNAITEYGPRPILLIVSEEDEYAAGSAQKLNNEALGNHRLHIYPGKAHGTDLFRSQADLQPTLLNWFHTIIASGGPFIWEVTADTAGQPPQLYKKVELTFNVDTEAQNLQLPYDPAPPQGIEPEIGITVDALFSPDNWETVFTQPAFYYQDFQHEIKREQDWIYPTANFAWKVRFTPTQTGTWQFKLVARDASGATETPPQTFSVSHSNKKGFVKVSPNDSRYFEFDNGDLFGTLGYNLTFAQLDWTNPTVANEPQFQQLESYGLQLFRTWLSQWSIFASAWNPWNAQNSELHTEDIPFSGLTFEEAVPQSDVSMVVNAARNQCMFIGVWKAKPAVKRNTLYQVRVRYKTKAIEGPRIANNPYGFVAKTGGWLWGTDNFCHDPGVGTTVTPYQPANTEDWQILEGEINSGDQDFLPNFYLVMENVTAGKAFVDYVWIQEDFGNGEFGPNIVSKPWMAQHLYFEQRNSYAFDKVLELAEKYNVFLKLVISEKNEWLLNRFDFEGNPIHSKPQCWDKDKSNDPEKCPGNRWFYGNYRQMTKTRWLQQAWWRYLQARWGYSPNIQSWELLNEGDPQSELHYTLADEFAIYMHQFKPNDHLVTTSFWHSFPGNEFWTNSNYPNLDYADIHAYAPESTDTANNSLSYSQRYGALQPEGTNMPFIRGETGFSDEVIQDKEGIWLHNYIWAGINPGGMIEQYWYSKEHIVQPEQENDLRYHYLAFKNFIEDIPLNNGNYQGVQSTSSEPDIRSLGQKDVIYGCAHLWIQNKNHTWKNQVDGVSIPAASGTITMSGFLPKESYTLEWWDTYQPDKAQQITETESIIAQDDGSISVLIKNLTSDISLKIISADGCTP